MKNKLFAAVGDVGDDLVARADSALFAVKKPIWIKIAAVAACVAVIGGVLAASPWKTAESGKLPVYDDAKYAATELYDLLYGGVKGNGTDGVGTKFYTTQFGTVKDIAADLPPLPTGTLPLWKYNADGPSVEEFGKNAQKVMPAFSRLTGVDFAYDPAQFDVEDDYFFYKQIKDGVQLYGFGYANSIEAMTFFTDETQPLLLDGKTVTIDTDADAESVRDSLKGTLALINEAFDTDFDVIDTQNFEEKKYINEQYRRNGSDEYDRLIVIRFYKSSADGAYPFGARITTPSVTMIFEDGICTELRYSFGLSGLEKTAVASLIPLEEAEKLLANGVVFGGHLCPICASMQESLDFTDYDLVSVEYVFGYGGDIVPFYAFYKTVDDINVAKVLVPAIELTGYDEFLQWMESTHVDVSIEG